MLRLTRRLRRSNAASAASLEDISSRSTPHQQHSGQGINWQRRSVENRGTISRQEHQPPRHQRPLNLAPRAPIIRESSVLASGTVGESANNQNRQQQRGRDRKVRAPAAPSREIGELDAKGAHLDDIDPRPWHQRTFESVDLICSICLEAFNRPITLPCWHSFCLLCLQNFLREYQQQSFSCPQCRQVVEVPAGGLRDFPCNPRLKEALELHEKRRAVLIKRAAARISSDESSSSKDNPNEDPGLDPAELREVLLTGISLLRSEALEKIEIVKDIGRSIEDQIEAEYKLRIELLGKMRSHARQKCQAALSEVSSAISDVDRRLDEELSSYDQDGRAGGDNGNTWTADKAERSQDTFPKRLAELRQELNAIDVSSLVSFDPRSFRVSVVSSAVRNGRDPQRRMLATAEGSSDSRSVSPAVRRVMGAEANTEEATSTESAARSSNKPRMGTSVVLSRGQNLPPSVASIATLRKKRPLSRTKALSGSEDLAALGLAFGLGREAPNGLMSTLSPASSLASLRSNNNANASSPSLRRVNSNASDNSRLTTYHDRGATANHTGSLAVRTKPRRTAILNATNEETGLLYKVTNFTTRIVVTSHQLLRPSGLVVCPWIVNANGRITATRATTRPANPADFFGASANDVYNGDNGSVAFLVVSADLHRVCLCRVEERGETTITKLFGKRGEAPGQFLHPVGIAVDRKRREIYVTDNWQHCVHVFSTDGKFLRRWGMRGTAPGHFTSPGGIAIDDERRDGPVVYLCDCGNNRVQILDPDGIFVGFLGSDPFSSSDDPAPRRSPAMDRNGNGAASFMLESKQELLVDTGFDEPISVAVDYRTGNVVVADSGNDRIKVYQTKGPRRPLLLSVFGSSGRWTGMFKKPDCVALDPDGFVFVAENGTRRVQVFTQDGEFVTQATRDFRWAGGMAVTSDRRMLIADYEKNQIRIVY